MRKALLVGLMVVFGMWSVASGAVTLSNIAFEDSDVGPVTTRGNIAGLGAAGGMVDWVADMPGVPVKIYLPPTMLASDGQWAIDGWNPYFRGVYEVTLTGIDFMGAPPHVVVTNHSITAAREMSGALECVCYFVNGQKHHVDMEKVKLHSIGYMEMGDAASVGCNLLNNTVDPSQFQDPSAIEAAFSDTSEHYPLGTEFSFMLGLHARPNMFMGMGEMKRFEMGPVDNNDPDGEQHLYFYIENCSPWRSDAEEPIGAHVGFAPIYLEDEEDRSPRILLNGPNGNGGNGDDDVELDGIIMWTTAHYMDVSPSLDDIDDDRLGLVVNGRAGTTSYLTMFLPDAILEAMGVTDPDEELAAYQDGALIGGLSFIERVEEGGASDFFVDWNGDGKCESGYLLGFEFSFPGAVGSSKASARATSTRAEIGKKIDSAAINDYNADGRSDYAIFDQNTGLWFVLSADQNAILAWGLDWGWPGAQPVSGDYNGDGRSDYAVFDRNTGLWFVLSADQTSIMTWGLDWGWPGAQPVSGDYNGDGRSDYAVFDQNTGLWFVLSADQASIMTWGLDWGWPGAQPVSGDYNGDGRSDYAVFDQNTGLWFVLSADQTTILAWGLDWGWPGAEPVSGDYNGDGRSDYAVFDQNTGLWFVLSADQNAILAWGLDWGWPGAQPVSGDYNGDGRSDYAVFDQNTGLWFVLSADQTSILAWGLDWGWPGAWPVR